LNDNLGASGWTLSDADMKKLDDVSAIEIPYPWNIVPQAKAEIARVNPNLY